MEKTLKTHKRLNREHPSGTPRDRTGGVFRQSESARAISSVLRPTDAPAQRLTPENLALQRSAKTTDPTTKKYGKQKAVLAKELKRIQGLKDKKKQTKEFVTFLTKIFKTVLNPNPFKKIKVEDLKTSLAETEWLDGKENNPKKEVEVSFDLEFLRSGSLENIISTGQHEAVHANQYKAGIDYKATPKGTKGLSISQKRVDDVLKSLGELDAYLAQQNEPFFSKTSKIYQKHVAASIKDYYKAIQKYLKAIEMPIFKSEQTAVMTEIPKFRELKKYNWSQKYKVVVGKKTYNWITTNGSKPQKK